MILLPHMLIGAAIGAKIHSAIAVFVFSIISHFIADKLPHWEYLDKELSDYRSTKEFLMVFMKIALDFGLGAILLFYFFQRSPDWPYVAIGALSAVLPDFFVFLNWLFPRIKILEKYRDFHHRNHVHRKYHQEKVLSVFSEGTVILLALYLVIRQL